MFNQSLSHFRIHQHLNLWHYPSIHFSLTKTAICCHFPKHIHKPSITSFDLLNILINSPLLKQINHLKQLYKNCQITCQNKIFPFKIHKSKIKSSASIQLNHEFTLTESIKGLHWVVCHCLPSTSSGNFNIHRRIKTARRVQRPSEGIIYYLWIAPRAKHHQIIFLNHSKSRFYI